LDRPKHSVTLTYRDQTEQHEIREGAPLQILDRESAWMMPRFDCRKAECGLCIVYVTQGLKNLNKPLFIEEQTLRAMRAPANGRLACQIRVEGPVVIQLQDIPGS
jgi:ferredoxin